MKNATNSLPKAQEPTTKNSPAKPDDWRTIYAALPLAAQRLVLCANAYFLRLIQYKSPAHQPTNDGLWRCSLNADHTLIQLSFEPDQPANVEARAELNRLSSEKGAHLQVLKQTRASIANMLRQPEEVQRSNKHTLDHWDAGVLKAEAEVARIDELEEAYRETLSKRTEQHYSFPADLGE